MPPEDEAVLLNEIARLYTALIRVVSHIEDPGLKAEIGQLIWPPTQGAPMAEPIPVIVATTVVDKANVLRDVLERAAVTFLIGLLTAGGLDAGTDWSADWGKKLSLAVLFAVASVVVRFAIPKSGFGLPPVLDVAARAALSGLQGVAVFVLANQTLDWFALSNWQLALSGAIPAALSVLKGSLAIHVRPDETVTPASLAPAK